MERVGHVRSVTGAANLRAFAAAHYQSAAPRLIAQFGDTLRLRSAPAIRQPLIMRAALAILK